MLVRRIRQIPTVAAAALASGALASYAVLMLTPWLTGTLRLAVADLPQLCTVGLAGVLAAVATNHHRGRSRWCWATLLFMVALSTVAMTVNTVTDLLGGLDETVKTVENILWTVATLAGLPALLFLPITRRQGAARAAMLLDGAIVAGSVLFVSEASIVPFIIAHEPDVGSALTDLALIGIDIVLIAVAMAMVAVAAPRARLGIALLLGGLVLNAIAGTGQTFLNVQHAYSSGKFPDIFILAAYLALIAAAMSVIRQPWPTVRPRNDVAGGIWVVLPYLPLAMAGGVAVSVGLSHAGLSGPEVATFATLVVTVMLRQFLALVDNQRLARALRGREHELTHLAHHDPLTGLANRRLFHDRLADALVTATDRTGYVCLMFIDLDDFKDVNDALGHELGDQLLVTVAQRLLDCMRPHDTVARLGGDEFAILISSVANEADAVSVATRITSSLRDPATIGGQSVQPRATIGIALTCDLATTSSQFISQADVAMYVAKLRGKDGVQVYRPEMRDSVIKDLSRHLQGDTISDLELS